MKYGINSLTWVSPFTNKCLHHFDRAKKFGFDVYELGVEEPSTIDTKAISKASKDAGIEITIGSAHGPTRDLASDDPSVRRTGLEYLKILVDIAFELDSVCIAGPMYSCVGKARQVPENIRETELRRAADGLRIIGEYAASSNKKLKLAVEPLNRFETDMINTVDQGLALLDMIGLDNLGLLLDTFHMNIEEKNICESIRKAKGRIANFHACANDRGTPGEDNFDWPSIAKALNDALWNERVVIESLTKDCVEIAKAASIWRSLAASPDDLAVNGVRFLKTIFA